MIEVVRAIPDTLLFAGAGAYSIDLNKHFNHTDKIPLHFAIESSVGRSLRTSIAAHQLIIVPDYPGVSQLEVRAFTDSVSGSVLTFSVDVRRALQAAQAFSDTSVTTQDQSWAIPLGRYFSKEHPGSLIYQITTHEGTASRAEIVGDVLHLTPVGHGTDELMVTASVDQFSVPGNPFEVNVTACATALGDSLVSYFPHEVGQSWAYDYTYKYSDGHSEWEPYEDVGMVTWTVLEPVVQDACTFGMIVQVKGEAIRNLGPDTLHWEEERFVALRGRRLVFPDITYKGKWDLSVDWAHPVNSAAEIRYYELVGCFRGCHDVELKIEAGKGIVYWKDSDSGAGGTRRYEMTLRE